MKFEVRSRKPEVRMAMPPGDSDFSLLTSDSQEVIYV